MSDIRADVLNAMRIVENENVPRGSATIHHPKCPLVRPHPASAGRPPTLADCNCGGALFPVRVP